jgi:stage II sporulation protein D
MRGPSPVVATLILLLTFGAACALQSPTLSIPSQRRIVPKLLRVRVTENGRTAVRQVPLEEYVHAAILSEFAPAAGDATVVERMLQVQAVISRTYAMSHLGRHARDGYDLCATTHCQLFEPARRRTSRWAGAAADAVRKTSGVVLLFDREPATALFHADCGGHTSTPTAVWGGRPHAYLRARADDGPAERAHTTWRYDATQHAIRLALNADARTAVGARLEALTVLERDDAGRATRVRLKGQQTREVTGEVVRDALTRAFGVRSIRSTWFEIRKQRTSFVFEGRGFGHGVGLCQAGALARIEAGTSPSAVLLRYFPGTRLTSVQP